jgi:hypothetical protein
VHSAEVICEISPLANAAQRHVSQFSYLRRCPAAWTEKERLRARVSLSALTETAATGIERNVRVWACRIRPQRPHNYLTLL